jgi:hypothetical protein
MATTKRPVPGGDDRAAAGGEGDRITAAQREENDEPAAVPRRQTRNAQADPPGLEPLPTKEESLREIEEEAERKDADRRAKRATQDEAARLEKLKERIKFREELRVILAHPGGDARLEIDKLAQRYGYDTDHERYGRADQIWRFARVSQETKVRLIRALDLPESVILDLLSNNLHVLVKTRNGPRDENEVRVWAARQLLSYELPGERAARRPKARVEAGGGAAGAPAQRGNDAASPPR